MGRKRYFHVHLSGKKAQIMGGLFLGMRSEQAALMAAEESGEYF